MPGSNTSTFLAVEDPILITPTLLYFAGVPGTEKPFIQVTPRGAAGVLAEAIGAKLGTSVGIHPIAIAARRPRLIRRNRVRALWIWPDQDPASQGLDEMAKTTKIHIFVLWDRGVEGVLMVDEMIKRPIANIVR